MLGELTFSAGKVAAWKKLRFDPRRFTDWADGYENRQALEAAREQTVGGLLDELAGFAGGDDGEFVRLELARGRISLRGLLGADSFREWVYPIATMFRAGAALGAAGKLRFTGVTGGVEMVVLVGGGASRLAREEDDESYLEPAVATLTREAAAQAGRPPPAARGSADLGAPSDVTQALGWVLGRLGTHPPDRLVGAASARELATHGKSWSSVPVATLFPRGKALLEALIKGSSKVPAVHHLQLRALAYPILAEIEPATEALARAVLASEQPGWEREGAAFALARSADDNAIDSLFATLDRPPPSIAHAGKTVDLGTRGAIAALGRSPRADVSARALALVEAALALDCPTEPIAFRARGHRLEALLQVLTVREYQPALAAAVRVTRDDLDPGVCTQAQTLLLGLGTPASLAAAAQSVRGQGALALRAALRLDPTRTAACLRPHFAPDRIADRANGMAREILLEVLKDLRAETSWVKDTKSQRLALEDPEWATIARGLLAAPYLKDNAAELLDLVEKARSAPA
jgi:hypothetical protein